MSAPLTRRPSGTGWPDDPAPPPPAPPPAAPPAAPAPPAAGAEAAVADTTVADTTGTGTDDVLREVERRVLWLATSIVQAANRDAERLRRQGRRSPGLQRLAGDA